MAPSYPSRLSEGINADARSGNPGRKRGAALGAMEIEPCGEGWCDVTRFAIQRALTRAPKGMRWNETRACYWCGRAVTYRGHFKQKETRATREHIVPVSVGGGDGGNRVVACKRCNQGRGRDMTWVPFHQQPVEARRRGTPLRHEGAELVKAL